jgi:CheY-like chemotaxis protein
MSKSILIVDDNATVRRMLCASFESEGDFTVCGEGVDGVEAIEKARELKPDLLVLDLSMPRMNGLMAAEALHDILPGMPIILFTVHAEEMLKRAIPVGVSAIVSKRNGMAGLLREMQTLAEADRSPALPKN